MYTAHNVLKLHPKASKQDDGDEKSDDDDDDDDEKDDDEEDDEEQKEKKRKEGQSTGSLAAKGLLPANWGRVL